MSMTLHRSTTINPATLAVIHGRWARRLAGGFAWAIMLVAPGPVGAQAHSQQFGDYTVRSSTVAAESLSDETARAHGIKRAPGRAVLNVVVQQSGREGSHNVPAQVRARVTRLDGVSEQVDMRETWAQGRVAYTGTYGFLPRQVVDISVTVRPEGGDRDLALSYRERLWTSAR